MHNTHPPHFSLGVVLFTKKEIGDKSRKLYDLLLDRVGHSKNKQSKTIKINRIAYLLSFSGLSYMFKNQSQGRGGEQEVKNPLHIDVRISCDMKAESPNI